MQVGGGFMNKLSVGQRLAILVALPLAVILILVISSLSSFSSINAGVGRIYDARVVPLTQLKIVNDAYAATVVDAINKTDRGMMTPMEAVTEINAALSDVQSNWQSYKAGEHSDRERELIREIDQFLQPANARVQEALRVLGPLGDSMVWTEDGDTVIGRFDGDLYEYLDPITLRIAELIDLQLTIARQEREAAQAIYDGALMLLIVAAVVVALVMSAVGWWVARSVSAPLARLREAMDHVERNRDLTIRVDVQQSDEIGQVARAFQALMDRFRDILGDVRNTSNQLNGYADTLTNNTELTREGVAVQTRETDQVATASTQMTHAIEEVSRHAHQAAEAAGNANQETEAGNRVLDEAIHAINALAARLQEASAVIHRVETDSAAIGTVLDVIRGIAEQTNLLALNAAIEAARAGEQGRGFAVVADEVRSLAQRTQESTQEIQAMIERLQAGAQEAVRSMADGTDEMERTVQRASRAGESLSAIASAVSLISDMNTQIASATEEQMTVSQEISRNVVNISDVARSSEHSVQEVESASLELKQSAQRLAALVNEFTTG